MDDGLDLSNLSPEAFYGFDPGILENVNIGSLDVGGVGGLDLSSLGAALDDGTTAGIQDIISGLNLEGSLGFGGYDLGGNEDLFSAALQSLSPEAFYGEGMPIGESVFNAARDSQLYNDLFTRDAGLAGYLDPNATPSIVYENNLPMGNFVPSTFNAAKDSQFANELIERGAPGFEHLGSGPDAALKGYQAPGATPSRVRINGGQYGPDIKGSDGKTYRVGTDGKTVIDKETDKPVTNTNTVKEILQKYFTTTGSQPQQQPNLLSSLLPLLLMMMAMRNQGGSSGSSAVIPALTATQKQTPYTQQQQAPGYRPGQGGITYFNPVQYAPRMAEGGLAGLAKQRGTIDEIRARRAAKRAEREAEKDAEKAALQEQMDEILQRKQNMLQGRGKPSPNAPVVPAAPAPVVSPVAEPVAAPVAAPVAPPAAAPALQNARPFASMQATNYADVMQQPGYRPGQGGVTFFNPVQFGAGMANGGIVDLARMLAAQRRAKGGRLLQGRGDGVSDSIPAMIGNDQPARLARGEYVVDARTVAELGNGSTDAGAERLDEMRKRVHAKRKKAGVGQDSKAYKHLPA